MTSIRQSAGYAIVCFGLFYAGCGSDGELGPRDASTAPATSPDAQVAKAQQRVTGIAFITLPPDLDPNQSEERFNFTAARRQDGVRGRFQLYSEQNTGLRLRGRITCLAIEGTTARLGGVITGSSDAQLEGSPILWTVVDRGRGGATPPDLTTDVFLPLFSHEVEEFCAGTHDPGLPLIELERGNIQIYQ